MLESWLNDPGTNLPSGKVVLPTAMKGMVPHAQQLPVGPVPYSTSAPDAAQQQARKPNRKAHAMFYTHEWADGKGRSTIKFNPVRIAARVRSQHRIYVVPTTRKRRVQLIECLEANGFACNEHWGRKREEVISRGFPLDISLDGRTYTDLGSVTGAACACSSGIVAPEGLFYELCQDKLDFMPGEVVELAKSWRDEAQADAHPANYARLIRIGNVPR